VFPQERDPGLRSFANHTQPVLEFFTDRIGPYPYEKRLFAELSG
jgi:hypothetical protein